MKALFLRMVMYLAGLSALLFAVAVRMDWNWQKSWLFDPDIVYDTDTTGDLYQMSLVKDFDLRPGPRRSPRYDESDRQPVVNDADLLVMGDSFLDHGRESASLMELVGDALNLRVFYSPHGDMATTVLDIHGCTRSRKRILVFERVERYLSRIDSGQEGSIKSIDSPAVRLAKPLTSEELWTRLHARMAPAHPGRRGMTDILRRAWSPVGAALFPEDQEKKYYYALRCSRWTSAPSGVLATIRFRSLGYISDLTPVYSRDPPFLFYYDSVDDSPTSAFYRHSAEEFEGIVSEIVRLQLNVRRAYNLELVFMPVPNKITIYRELVTDRQYNDLLPRLCGELEGRGVPVVRLYESFRASDDLLYYPDDTHWNEAGVRLATRICLDKIRELMAGQGDASSL